MSDGTIGQIDPTYPAPLDKRAVVADLTTDLPVGIRYEGMLAYQTGTSTVGAVTLDPGPYVFAGADLTDDTNWFRIDMTDPAGAGVAGNFLDLSSAPTATVNVISSGSSNFAGVRGYGATGPTFRLERVHGATTGSAVQANDVLGVYAFAGADAVTAGVASIYQAASIRTTALENFTAGTTGGAMVEIRATPITTQAITTIATFGQLANLSTELAGDLYVSGTIVTTSGHPTLGVRRYGSNTNMRMERVNGTIAAPSPIVANDVIGIVSFGGAVATVGTAITMYSAASMRATATSSSTGSVFNSQLELRVSSGGVLTTSVLLADDLSATFSGAVAAGTTLAVGTTSTFTGEATFSGGALGVLDITRNPSNTVNVVTASSKLTGLRAYGGNVTFRLTAVGGTAGAPTVTQSGDVLGIHSFAGAAAVSGTTVTVYQAASIRSTATGTFSGTVGGAQLEMRATPTNSQSLATVGYFDQTTSFVGGLSLVHEGAATGSGDTVAVLSFRGAYNTTAGVFVPAGQIAVIAEQAFSSSQGGSRITFLNCPAGSITLTTRGGIDSGGTFFVGTNGARVHTVDASGNTVVSGTLGVSAATTLSTTLGVTGVATFNALPIVSVTSSTSGITLQRDTPSSALASAVILATISFAGAYSAGNFVTGGTIIVSTEETLASGAAGSRMVFATATATTTTLVTRFGADSASVFFVGTNSARVLQINTTTGTVIATPSAVQVLAAATAISPNAFVVHISSTASRTLTATPTITAGTAGQLLIIVNDNTTAGRTITFQSNDTLAGSALSLSATTQAVGPGGAILLEYSAEHSKWVQIGLNLGGHI